MTATKYRALAAAGAALALLAGCSDPPAAGAAAEPTVIDLPPDARLAARSALAQDQFYSGTYSYTPAAGGPVATVIVARARQSFLVELGTPGRPSTTIIDHPDGDFYCRTSASAGGCMKWASAGKLAEKSEPARMKLAFTRWLRTLASHQAPLSIADIAPPPQAKGTCFSVEGIAASLDPPVDAGIYCFDDSGRITALRLAGGTLLATGFGPAPATVTLPAPVGDRLPTVDPPVVPSASAATGGGGSPSATPSR